MKCGPAWLGVALLMSTSARADTVCDWMEAAEAAADLRPDGRTAEQIGLRTRVALAMFEALNAIDRQYTSQLGVPPESRPASPEAAAATAAYEVLVAKVPAFRASLENTFRATMAAAGDEQAREVGRRLGKIAARAAVEAPTIDDRVLQKPYRPRTKAGVWIPTDLPYHQPFDLAQKPWVMASASAVRPSGPPALTSARWARDFEEVKRLGVKDSAARTPEQTLQARFWALPDLIPTLRRLSEVPGRTLLHNARLFALAYMALDDAALAGADAKMFYGFWRPLTAIRNGELDGNPATAADPAWEPLLTTPNHPEFPCLHCLNAAALATVLTAEFGPRPPGGVRFTKRQMPGVVLTVPTFADYLTATSFSRILGGVHFRSAIEAGESMGKKIGNLVLDKALTRIAQITRETPAAGSSKTVRNPQRR